MKNVKEGANYLTKILSVETKIISMSDYLQMDPKPDIYHEEKVFYHIGKNDFAITGRGYGDEDWHFIKYNKDYVEIVTDRVLEPLIDRMIRQFVTTVQVDI